MPSRYRLYGAELSLYSGKVRSYLRKKGLAFDEIAASLKIYKKLIVPKTGVSYIPVVETPSGEFLQDTSIIIESIEAQHTDHSALPTTPKQRFVAQLIELYADEWLVIPAMHYRWNFPEQNQPFIYQEFGRVVLPWAPRWLRAKVGRKAGARFKGAVENLGITPSTIPAIETSYKAFLADLNEHFAHAPFVLGTKPSIADFGLIGPLYAHLYRDPYPGQLMRHHAPRVADWVERMMNTSPDLQQGEYFADDQIPASLEPIIQRFAQEQWPVLKDTNSRLGAWVAENAQTKVPRYIGKHRFVIGDAAGERVVLPYSLWMLQRLLEQPETVQLADDASFVKWLNQVGLGDILSLKFETPMSRVNNRLTIRG